jgi:hypothetical protein
MRPNLDEAPKKRVAAMAEISSTTFPSLVSRMAKKGLVEYGSTSEMLKITGKGLDQVDPIDMPTSNVEAQERVKEKLKGKPLRIFEILQDGKAHEKEDIMKAIDCTNPKTFAPMVSRELKKHGYIEFPIKTSMELAESVCFPFGRD